MTTIAEVRWLAWRYHDIRPDGESVARTEWAIETQLALAADYAEHDLHEVLIALRPGLDESLTRSLDELLDLAEEVSDAELSGPAARYYAAVDDYAAALRRVALLVRGGGLS